MISFGASNKSKDFKGPYSRNFGSSFIFGGDKFIPKQEKQREIEDIKIEEEDKNHSPP